MQCNVLDALSWSLEHMIFKQDPSKNLNKALSEAYAKGHNEFVEKLLGCSSKLFQNYNWNLVQNLLPGILKFK